MGSAAAIAGSAVTALMPLVVREIVDEVVLARAAPLGPWLLLFLGAALVRVGCTGVRRWSGGLVQYSVERSLRDDLFVSLQRLDGAQQDRLRTGQVVSRSITDVNAVGFALGNIPLLASNVLMFAMSLVIMLVLSLPLTLIALIAAPVMFGMAKRSSSVLSPAYRGYLRQAGVVAGVVEAAVSGVRVVKGFGQEAREQARYEQAASRLYHAGVYRARRASMHFPMLEAIPALGQVGVLAFGGWLALSGQITLGTFLAFATYLTAMIGPLRWLVDRLPDLQETKSGLLRLFEVIDAEPTIVDRRNATEAPSCGASVELEGMTFGYVPEHPVLRDLSLRVEPGETVALVGGAGSGKSTVALLLARFYDPDSGVVRYAGHDVRDLSLGSLRSRVGMVFEDVFLFSDTIRANIGFGRPDAADPEIEAAARAAEAAGFIRSLPDGYDTVIGERGLTLSGGQRQRIALARALLTDPSVLVLDDATSAIDAGIEAEIHATLRRVMRDRTTLLIAHRHSSLQLADRIAVLDHGQLLDIGTHDELTARCSRYRLLLSGYDEPGGDRLAGELGADTAGTTGAELVTSRLWNNPPPAGDDSPFGAADAPERDAQRVLDTVPDQSPFDLTEARRPAPGFRARDLLGPLWAALALLTAVLALDAGAQLAVPWLTRLAIDEGVTPGVPGMLWAASAVALVIVAAAWALRIVQTRTIGRIGERIRLWLGVRACAQLQRLGLDFYERERGGQIMTPMTADLNAVTQFVQRDLAGAVVAVVTFVGVLAVMLTIDAGLTLAVAATLPLFAAAVLIYRHRSNTAYDTARNRLADINASFQENLAGTRLTQAYGRENHNIAAFTSLTGAHRRAQLVTRRYWLAFNCFTELIHDLATLVVLGVGAARVTDGSLTPGGIIAFLLYITLLFGPIETMSYVADAYQRAVVGLHRIRDLVRTPTSTPQAAHPVPVGQVAGGVGFDGVRFTYPGGDHEALRGITAQIEPGETIAVVGETGAGKSTLLKLLARFYDPTEGVTRVDGTDLRDLDLDTYRLRLGIVPQESYLFDGSVADTIRYGRPDAPDASVEAAARAVGAHEMVATLRHGYHHPVGERGAGLSAGQRQLLALARAQLVNPDILLLDEASASLDLATEAAVTRATQLLSRRRTTLLIAHRLTTAAHADRILVLHHGRLTETGTHDELMTRGGRYAELWHAFTGTPQDLRPS